MIKVIIDWYELKALAKEDAELYTLLMSVSINKLVPLEDILIDKGYCNFEGFINDIKELPDEILKRAKFEILRPMKLLRENGMTVKKENINELFTAVQVHLPGNELLKIRELELLSDACTDSVQQKIKDGWKILAICPMPTRRPDYIMGMM